MLKSCIEKRLVYINKIVVKMKVDEVSFDFRVGLKGLLNSGMYDGRCVRVCF